MSAILLPIAAIAVSSPASANDRRLNDAVVSNVYTIQRQAGCVNDVKIDPRLRMAAQRHAIDIVHHRQLDGDVGSDGSTTQDRARDTGFDGAVAQTVAINPALAISGIEILQQWYYNPVYYAIMSNCEHTLIGVWSENRFDRSVVVAVYGDADQGS